MPIDFERGITHTTEEMTVMLSEAFLSGNPGQLAALVVAHLSEIAAVPTDDYFEPDPPEFRLPVIGEI
jgi:hypothetical protein